MVLTSEKEEIHIAHAALIMARHIELGERKTTTAIGRFTSTNLGHHLIPILQVRVQQLEAVAGYLETTDIDS